jgi:hypothetical protein
MLDKNENSNNNIIVGKGRGRGKYGRHTQKRRIIRDINDSRRSS